LWCYRAHLIDLRVGKPVSRETGSKKKNVSQKYRKALRYQMQNNEISAQDTFPKLLEYQARTRGNKPALRRKILGIWQTWTWSETAAEVQNLACGLAAKGFKRGDKLAIMGDSRPRFFFAMTAAHCLGGVPVPTYPDGSADELIQILNNSEARFAIVQDQEQVDKLLEIKDRCPKFQETIAIEPRGLQSYDRSHLHAYIDVVALGRKYHAEHPNFFTEQVNQGKTDDTAVILYTSGTTGTPKGVMFSHKSMMACGRNSVEQKKLNADSETLAILPLATTTAVLVYYVEPYLTGFCVNCPESSETIITDMREIGPKYFIVPPHVLTYMYNFIILSMLEAGVIKRAMFDYFSGAGRNVQPLAWLLVTGPLKDVLGLSRVRIALISGDFLSEKVFDFFHSLGVPLKQSYGPTEGFSFVTIQPEGGIKSESVGLPVKDVEIKFTDEGEILFRSPAAFQGYNNDPQATAEVKTADGWIKTGDTGEFDKDGQLVVIGRFVDVGRLNSGDRFVPKSVENRLKSFPQVKEVISVGHQRDFVTAVVNINSDVVRKWADKRALIYSGYSELAGLNETYGLIKECIEKVNQDLSRSGEKHLQIKRFAILNSEMSADGGELTRSHKLRRPFIGKKYEKLIDAMYAGNNTYTLEFHDEQVVGQREAAYTQIKILDAQTF
jgi:long-chain acyl-CoA synthetase